MKPPKFNFQQPNSLHALIQLLQSDEDVRIIAGGQSLMPMLNYRLARPDVLIDISQIQELKGIALDADGSVRVGAMTTHRDIEQSKVIKRTLPFLPFALGQVAHVAIRNKGTIGGSLAHSDPSAEWPALCLFAECRVELNGPAGKREVGIDEFLCGLFTTALEPGELIVGVHFPVWPEKRCWGFQEVSRRAGDFAIAGVAAWVEFDAGGLVSASRVVAFAVEDRPSVLPRVAASLHGKALTPERLALAGKLASSAVRPRSDIHASTEYRSELMEVLVERTLMQAWEQQRVRDE